MEEREMSAAFSAEPEMDEPEPQYDEPEMDEPESRYDEPERPTPDADIQQALRSKLENDFGQLPPNVVIGGIPNHNSGYRSGNAGGFGR